MTDTAASDPPIERLPVVPIFASAPPAFFQATAADGITGDRSAILAASIDTAGIARNMNSPTPLASGGGNLNGSTNQQLLGQAGTAGVRVSVPRTTAGNFCGVV